MTDQNNAAQAADQEIEAIMEQAQVFASAWAFLGGPFDNGSGLEQAERERSNLRALLSKLRAEGVQAGESHPLIALAELRPPGLGRNEQYRAGWSHGVSDATQAVTDALASAPVAHKEQS
ncbi:hypothetical protein [Achromobacter piechaudii]|uniref:Uncharacterized protein n=1 Tax=Achromobacter piechaudii ATCC 43553 TaxID=742159 RepID=D4XJS4_9BURK|nr:hypothetical protein [Achromobacter piechaudii]EFF72937.1 hypothetical protein HMPREF0004_5721 [Achromobacter piechaudii ATCC 43553]